jgi:hypothetical protein
MIPRKTPVLDGRTAATLAACLAAFSLDAGLASAATLTANPFSANAGVTIRLEGSGFTPGGYPGIVLWDGREVERFFIPIDGTFFQDFVVPADAAVGGHLVAVCAAALGTPCAAGDLAQRASTPVTVAGPAAPLASFDILPRAVEVTQGLRTAIPSRADRDGTFTVVDPFEHVPGRRTVVRVHPRLVVEDGPIPSGGAIPPVTATLVGLDSFGAFLPGSPLSPVNSSVRADSEWTLNDTRRNPDRSWNFLLPETWTAEGNIRLLALVNPLGPSHQPECKGCGANNALDVTVSFRQVQTQDIELKIYATELFWRDAAGKPRSLAPSSADIARTVGWWLGATPVDPRRLRMSWRWGRMAWDYSADIFVKPAIPGVPDALTFQSDVSSENAGATQNYTVLPIMMSHHTHPNPPSGIPGRAPLGCAGGAAVGGPPKSLTSATCGPVFAQEATHALGFHHACSATPCDHGEESGGGFDPGYPSEHGAVEDDAFGFDTSTMVVLPPERFDNHTHDFMSYGGSTANPFNIFGPIWVSMYTWQNIIGAYRSVPAPTSTAARRARAAAPSGSEASAGGPYLEIAGRILADDSVELRPAFFVTLPESAPAPVDDPEGDYFLELYGPGRRLLYVRRFEPRPHTAHGFGDAGFPAAVFHELIPAISGVRRIAVFHDDEELAARDVSDAAPSVGILRPAGPTKWASEGEEVVAWSATDPNGGPLSYRLEASRDGIRWVLLAAGAETQAALDLSKLPMGKGDWRLRVQVSDGFNVGADEAGPVNLEARAPVALIVAPVDGEVVRSGAAVELFGLASDLQDPVVPEPALTWLLDGKVVGTGRRVALPAVSPGRHVADLRVTTAEGPTGSMAVAFFVEDAATNPNTDTDEDGLVDSAEWMEFGTLPLVRDTDQDLLDDGFEVQLGTDPTRQDTDGDGIPDGREFGAGSDPKQPDLDSDGDQVADPVDNCQLAPNADQADFDGDGLGDACDPDADGDRVENAGDACALTAVSATVDPSGCSIEQLCPCAGPSGGHNAWKSHGDYVQCVVQQGLRFRSLGLIAQREFSEMVNGAAQSRCGEQQSGVIFAPGESDARDPRPADLTPAAKGY